MAEKVVARISAQCLDQAPEGTSKSSQARAVQALQDFSLEPAAPMSKDERLDSGRAFKQLSYPPLAKSIWMQMTGQDFGQEAEGR
jgi:hypothetical protein